MGRGSATLYHMAEVDTKGQATQTIEAVKLLADWAKWLITIETTAIAAVALVTTVRDPYTRGAVSVLASGAVFFFVLSIISATLLLRSLPGIMQTIEPSQSIWETEDSNAMISGFNTLALVRLESTFFGIGLLLIGALLIEKIMVWP